MPACPARPSSHRLSSSGWLVFDPQGWCGSNQAACKDSRTKSLPSSAQLRRLQAVSNTSIPTMTDLESGQPASGSTGYLEPLGKALSAKSSSGTGLSKAFLSSGMPVTFKVSARGKRSSGRPLVGLSTGCTLPPSATWAHAGRLVHTSACQPACPAAPVWVVGTPCSKRTAHWEGLKMLAADERCQAVSGAPASNGSALLHP